MRIGGIPDPNPKIRTLGWGVPVPLPKNPDLRVEEFQTHPQKSESWRGRGSRTSTKNLDFRLGVPDPLPKTLIFMVRAGGVSENPPLSRVGPPALRDMVTPRGILWGNQSPSCEVRRLNSQIFKKSKRPLAKFSCMSRSVVDVVNPSGRWHGMNTTDSHACGRQKMSKPERTHQLCRQERMGFLCAGAR